MKEMEEESDINRTVSLDEGSATPIDLEKASVEDEESAEEEEGQEQQKGTDEAVIANTAPNCSMQENSSNFVGIDRAASMTSLKKSHCELAEEEEKEHNEADEATLMAHLDEFLALEYLSELVQEEEKCSGHPS
ncbi:hypothetical protein ACTXT7_009961 [Hymenolepis weldensis]